MNYETGPANATVNLRLSKTFGFPAYMDQQLPIIHGGPGTSIPSFGIGGYTTASGLHILSTENSYLLAPSLSWVKGKHTLKFGADWRDQQNGYYQNFDGGSLSTAINGTCSNALNCGASGNGMASMLLGFSSAYSVSAFSFPYSRFTIRATGHRHLATTPKLTVTMGLRYESRAFIWAVQPHVHQPDEVNPTLAALGIKLNGQPILGAVDFVNTPQHPAAIREHFRLFAPG